MPIARRNFDLGILPDVEEWMRGVYNFLVAHQGDAFDYDELYDAVRQSTLQELSPLDPTYAAALSELQNRGAASIGYVSGKQYYAYAHALNTETWEPA